MTTVRASLVFPAQAGIQTRDADARMRRAAHTAWGYVGRPVIPSEVERSRGISREPDPLSLQGERDGVRVPWGRADGRCVGAGCVARRSLMERKYSGHQPRRAHSMASAMLCSIRWLARRVDPVRVSIPGIHYEKACQKHSRNDEYVGEEYGDDHHQRDEYEGDHHLPLDWRQMCKRVDHPSGNITHNSGARNVVVQAALPRDNRANDPDSGAEIDRNHAHYQEAAEDSKVGGSVSGWQEWDGHENQ